VTIHATPLILRTAVIETLDPVCHGHALPVILESFDEQDGFPLQICAMATVRTSVADLAKTDLQAVREQYLVAK